MRSSFDLVEFLEDYLKEKKINRRKFCALVDITNSTISSWKSKNLQKFFVNEAVMQADYMTEKINEKSHTAHCKSGDDNEQGL